MKYKNLVEYLNKNDDCYDALMDAVNKFIYGNKNNLDFSTDLIPNPFGYIKVEDATISSLHTEMLPQNYVLMHCNVYADIAIKGRAYGKWKSDVEEDCKTIWLTLKIKAKFVDVFSEFKIIDVRHIEDKDRYSIKNSANKNFIPYIRTEDLDSYATNFLLHYYPEALKTPMPLSVEDVASAMKLKVLGIKFVVEGLFGQCYFADQKLNFKDGTHGTIRKGTIMYHKNLFFFNGIGSVRNTIIHECVHWELHKKYFALRRLLDPTLSAISCTVLDSEEMCSNKYSEDYYWMEWQANALTPRILMPAEMTKIKYKEIKAEIEAEGEKDEIKKREEAVKRLAEFFKVSLTSAKIRLIDLGNEDYKGIHNYIDDHLTQSYVYNKKNPNIKQNQTFSGSIFDSIESVASNEHLRNCLINKSIVYVSGFFVINNSKYVRVDQVTGRQELTNYALTHMDECCLVYDNKRRSEWEKRCQFDDRYYSMCFLSRRQKDKDNYIGIIEQNAQNDYILQKTPEMADVQDDYELVSEVVDYIKGCTFAESLTYLMDNPASVYGPNNYDYDDDDMEDCKYSNRALQKRTKIDDKKIAELKNGITAPTKYEVLAIIAGMRLHPYISEYLLKNASITLVTNNKVDKVYLFLVLSYSTKGLEFWNDFLILSGHEHYQLPRPNFKAIKAEARKNPRI